MLSLCIFSYGKSLSFIKLQKHVSGLSQKLTAEKIHGLGQKVMHGGHVLGRKVCNSLEKL